MSVARMLRMAMVVAVTIACNSDTVFGPIRGSLYAAATFQCGPADGPATAIYIKPEPVGSIAPSTPFVRIYVPVAVEQLSDHAWPVSNGNSEATAWFHSTDANLEVATTGYMTVSSVASDKTIEGSVNLWFPDAGRVRGGFRATWIPGTVVCG
jgi:hypothetical protein